MHKFDKRGVGGSSLGSLFRHPQRGGAGYHVLRLGHEVYLPHFLKHQIAPRQRAGGMAARIVIRWSFHQADQQRRLREIEAGQRPVEIKVTGKAEPMNGAVAVLAEIYFIRVGFQDFVL